ncbi:MAG: DNA-binding protein WhiA [Oscillospiraceae bacterium]|nr:DNA-binding protein WhiA [Oscillospiraceae bacterium]
MSFAAELKKELCAEPLKRKEKMLAECYGMAIVSRGFDAGNISLVTENQGVAVRYAKLMERLLGVTAETVERERADGAVYTVSLTEDADRAALLKLFGHSGKEPNRRINIQNIGGEENYADFLRGIYLSCGSISDPNKSYHIELAVPFLNLSKELALMLSQLLSMPKSVRRRGDYVLYYKESEHIEDFLTFIGAPMKALEIMEIKVVKDVRNKVNRRTNCETANIDKTVVASARQVADIRLICEKKGMEFLPENLRELAQLRLENPEMSLAELGSVLKKPISRSGVNHRLERLAEIAEDLREKEKEA